MASKKTTKRKFSAKQIAAQKRFAQMARARAKAVRAKKKGNPKGKHVAGATKKQDRQYEHILESAKKSGRYKGREKEVAARTIRTQSNPELTDPEIFVLRAMKRINPRAVTTGALVSITEILRVVSYPHYKTKRIILNLASKGILALHEHDYPSSLTRAERKLLIAVRSSRGGLVYYIGAAVRDPKTLPRIVTENPAKRTRNKAGLSESDIARLPESAQRQIRAQLGTLEQAEERAKTPKQKRAVERRRRSLLARIGTRLRLIGQTKRFKVEARDLGRCKRRTVRVRGRHETDALAKAQSKLGRGYDQLRVKNSDVKAVKRIRHDFAGSEPRRVTKLQAPNGTPSNLAKLGTVVSIKTTRGRMKFKQGNPSGETWLCADKRGRMHLASSLPRLTDERARNFGRVLEIEYLERKPHLGYRKKTLFFHKMGEEGGAKPELVSDGRGGLKFRGGDYYLSPEGIRD